MYKRMTLKQFKEILGRVGYFVDKKGGVRWERVLLCISAKYAMDANDFESKGLMTSARRFDSERKALYDGLIDCGYIDHINEKNI